LPRRIHASQLPRSPKNWRMPSAPTFVARQLRRLRRLVFPALRRADSVPKENTARGLDLLYRFILARPPDEEGRDYYLRLIEKDGLTLRAVAAEIAASDEFQARLRDALPPDDTFIDAQALNTSFTVEELSRTAEDYYRTTLEFADRYLAKPFADPQDAPDLLGSFAQLVAGLRLAPGLKVLDFGAGACWTTRCLTQFGCCAIALDVSASALELGKQLYARLPPFGDQPAPQFLVFDGRRIDLPDASVDRILCFDAFHHVPNPAQTMLELGRVLRPGGVAGFSEPGPHHSKGSRSQYEMKNYTALERDVVMKDVWTWARAAGFQHLELAIFVSGSARRFRRGASGRPDVEQIRGSGARFSPWPPDVFPHEGRRRPQRQPGANRSERGNHRSVASRVRSRRRTH